ncbi:MAG TPA: DNA ligase D [Gaiellaceae bacterium]|nr:DNA ligase D [Gaiellaceae bacterium]
MPSLDAYKRKRDPRRTPEPFGGGRGRRGAPVFVVQRHDARRLHYDFRLERGGALASWAVPKGVPLEPGGRSLAVHVEDHPLEYASFAGEIPAGQYGAGTVELWDRGTYELLEEKPDGQLTVRLAGERLRGVWTLVPARLEGKEENWLLVRRRDPDASGEAPPPATYRPMLATLAAEPPRGPGWRFEVKFDGYRALAYVRGGECELVSRNGKSLTERFAAVARAVPRALGTPSAVLDGEVCALDEDGRPSFSAMQRGAGPLVYYVFDLLEADGEALVDRTLEERRARLEELLDRRSRTVRLSEQFEDGEALLQAARSQRLEGVMAKRLGSRYSEGRRTRDWLKVKTHGRQEFVVAGYTRGSGSRSGSLGSLVLAVVDDGALCYAGNVGTGFTVREIEALLRLLRPLERPDPPFPERPRMPRVRKGDVVWVEPELVVEVEFGEWTRDGRVRQPSYKGLRDDKAAAEVRAERPPELTLRAGSRELRLSNLDKVFWPEEGITKGDLVDYYRRIAPALLPHLAGRPFTMRRYPDGVGGKAFFQKDAPSHMPAWIRRHRALVSARSPSGGRKWVEFPVVNDELALLWMVNMGCIDMNTWYSRVDRPDRPDFVLFDLDPTPGVPWADTIEVALLVRELLDGLGLASFPKTSGGKGFHVLVPLDRRSTYDDSRAFAELVAGAIARARPGLATTQWSKSRRKGVLIDANQNGEGKTIASVYSVRPRPGAPVSTPLLWEEVRPDLDPSAFTMAAVLDRVAARGDLYEGVLRTRQSLRKALARLGG